MMANISGKNNFRVPVNHQNATGTSGIRTVEWDMMNKSNFFPLSMLSSFSIRCFLYPFTVVKTKIQIQRHADSYSGMTDAFKKIYGKEGVGGLYRGFWVSTFQLVSGLFYVTTYENVRQLLKTYNLVTDTKLRSLIGGGCSSLVGQTIIVPFDVISQHVMVLGQTENRRGKQVFVNPLNINFVGRSKLSIVRDITREVYRQDGLRGFYRGYMASLSVYVPNSALWWAFYQTYQDQLMRWMPVGTSALLVQCMAAPLSGMTTTILTNPLDIIRARLQVQRSGGFIHTFNILWEEERLRIFTKGLSARLVQSIAFSTMIILCYESVKRLSVSEEYRDSIQW